MVGDMTPGIMVPAGILHGTVHIGIDLIAGAGVLAGEVIIRAGIPHGIMTGTGAVVIMVVTMAVITAVTMVAIGDIIIITTAGRRTVISMDDQHLHVRGEIMQAVTVRQDHDPIYLVAEACPHVLLPTEVLLFATATNQDVALR